ncbi:uncharacterized protein VTP21DRAFT_5163 [Calcarisporiella thermophila]|uniref:uncharacterized protein n=1 Tax=Calcarisporiella thermophila TaxID=911321 RepID=UPI0037430808
MINPSQWTSRTYVFYAIWILIHGGLFIFGFFKQKLDKDLALLNSIGPSVWTSRGAGLVLAFDLAVILLPVCRNLIRLLRSTRLNRLVDMDENIWFHKVTAWSMLLFTIVHVTAHYINFYIVELRLKALLGSALDIHYKTWAGTTGHLMLLIMLLMYTTAAREIRTTCFEAFWYTHHLAFFFILLGMLHAKGCFVKTGTGECRPYFSWPWILVSYVLYTLERVWREIRGRRETYISKIIAHPGNVIEIQIKKPSMKYKVGQYLFLNVPEVSALQWHPFTITSSPDEDYVSVHIRQVGDWTRKLATRLGYSTVFKGEDSYMAYRETAFPEIRIDGPFGAPSEDVFKNEIAVLIGTGIGVTPFASVLKHIWIQHQKGRSFKLRRVEFFWICRDTSDFEWFQNLLRTVEEATFYLKFLRIHIYLTGKLNEDAVYNLMINDAGAAIDPLTELSSKTFYGRPNFGHIFSQMKLAIASGNYLPGINQNGNVEVGVFYCGPTALAKQLKRECSNASQPGIKFNLYKEHF